MLRARNALAASSYRLWALAALVVCLVATGRLFAAEGKAEADNVAPTVRPGQWIRLTLPIDDRVVQRIQRVIRRALDEADGKRPIFVLEFHVPPGAAEAGHGTQFEDAQKLARFLSSDALNAATTVAYLPTAIKGHAVLVALACDQIVMADDATLGEAGIDERVIDDSHRAAYRTIASRRRTVPVELALGLLDPARAVLKVNTGVSTEFVTPEQLKDLEKKHPIAAKEEVKIAGQPGQFTGAEGRRLGFVSFLAKERREVVRALELSPNIIEGDPAAETGWHPIRVDLRGPINAEVVDKVIRAIDDEKRRGVNFVCLWIESPGGSPVESLRLANYLGTLNPNEIRTVAYIPQEARADASTIAMACDQMIMHPRAVLGGAGAYEMSDKDITDMRGTIRDSIAKSKLRSWSLWAAMIDPQLAVYQCTRRGEVDYFSDEELEKEQPRNGADAQPWRKGEQVAGMGGPLQLTGTQAVEYNLAPQAIDSFAEFKQFYGLEDDPTLIEPGWADTLIAALREPAVAVLLLIIGGAALYIELHAPGIGIGGFVAAICFLLFFWSRYLGGTAEWLEITLFLAGLAFLLLEVFVLPGFGIFGLGGGALVLISLILASQTFILPRNEYQFAQTERTLLTLGAAAGGIFVTALILRRWLPEAPLFNQVFLAPPEGAEAETISQREMLVDLRNLLGATGTTTTPLTPGGKARFGNHQVDVLAEGEFLTRATPVVVTEVQGNRVVVRAMTEDLPSA